MRILVTLILVFGIGPVWAQTPNPGNLQKSYNELYSQILFEKTVWPKQLQSQKLKVDQSQDSFQASLGLVLAQTNQVKKLNRDIETQKQHLAFLKRVEPLSNADKEKIKLKMVSSGEFSSPSAVNLNSLSQKAGQLDQEANLKQSEINQNEQQIANLKNSAEYQGYLSRRSDLQRQKRQKENELSQIREDRDNAKSNINLLNFNLIASERREERARNRADRIRNFEIPSVRRTIQNDRREVQDLRQDTQQKVQTRNQVESRRDQTKARIQQKESQLNQEGADKPAIQAELQDLRQQLQQQNQRIRRLTTDIQNNRSRIQRLDSDIDSNQRKITQLDIEANRKDREAADEDREQIRLESAIRQWEREIADLNWQESGVLSDINTIESRLASVQSQINSYYSLNIRPIELTVTQLENEKTQLVNRRGQLLQARQDLVTQDQNILAAKNKIPTQENLIVQLEKELTVASQEISDLEAQSQILQDQLDAEIKSYNTLIARIENQRNQLKNLEAQMIEDISSKKNGGN